MLYTIISDLHANREALDAVLADAPPKSKFLCLGDVVGYGPDPNYVCEKLRELRATTVMGNHDAAVVGLIPMDDFSQKPKQSVLWTREHTSEENQVWLKSLPYTMTITDLHSKFFLVHGSPQDPETFVYVESGYEAKYAFQTMKEPLAFIGHTHLAGAFVSDPINDIWKYEAVSPDKILLELNDQRYVVNPGSVGQPRDGNPEAAYGLYDSRTRKFSWERVAYDIEATQAKIRMTSLPQSNANRLSLGK